MEWLLKGFFWLWLFALAIVSHAQDESGFISIDCGLLPKASNYIDNGTGVRYSSDATFVDAGESHYISQQYVNGLLEHQLRTVRSFPSGHRNCYNLTAAQAKGKKHLIRATFMYGNYDSKNQTPKFDLHLGVHLWTTVILENPTSIVRKEIVHVPSSHNLHVCLVSTGSGTPFISALELRPMNQNAYPINNESLAVHYRFDFGPEAKKITRYPRDIFDRIWLPYYKPNSSWLSTPNTVGQNNYNIPSVVMSTAATPGNASEAVKIRWGPLDPSEEYYYYMHFAEVEKLSSNQSRQFYIYLNDIIWYNGVVAPHNLSTTTVLTTKLGSTVGFEISLVRTGNSSLPPILNAMEMYTVKRFLQSQTDENDVHAIENIKSIYGLNRSNWQGDPCLPMAFQWEGLDCIIHDDKWAPRINYLNLSSSRLSGNVSPYLSNLPYLEYLDLSNNNLTGNVPAFLAELPSLKFLKLTGNRFSGPIPEKLLKKAKSGLVLRIDVSVSEPPNGRQAGERKKRTSIKLIIMLVTLVAASLIILAALVALRRMRQKHQVWKVRAMLNKKGEFLESKPLRFTHSELLKITNNFERVLGSGSFGTVYFGVNAGKQVAVKVLSHSSVQGYDEFQTEAELLKRVHHRNLTILVGYCYEDAKMALVYEYMAHGNLKSLLSDDKSIVLSWFQRLQIAIDAAQGLDYMHNGCKPPIIHRDVKSTNILLNEKLEAKLADFGLSRVLLTEDGSYVSTRVVGTPGYLDPEYHRSRRLHEKSDVYSFGIVILELITGRPASTMSENNGHIRQWVNLFVETGDIGKIVDQKLRREYDVNSAWKALELAMACSSSTSSSRPAMAYVLKELNECLVAEKARREGLRTISENLVELNPGTLEITQLEPR